MSIKPLFPLAFLIALLAISCATPQTSNSVRLPTTSITPEPSPTLESPVRLVDFGNLAYPNFPDYSRDQKRRITLQPGEGGPNFINYGDVTSDGSDDAMVALGIAVRGSAVSEYVYIFTVEKAKPKSIWDFETGDRADGGLRNVYAEKGHLVIELFGKDRVIGGELYRGEEGLCCPRTFTRASYRWTGSRFEEISREVLENPSGDANPLMPKHSAKN